MSFSRFNCFRAQGVVEYVIMLGVVLTIGLIAVGLTTLALNPIDLKKQATSQELKELGISIIENSFNSSSKEFLLRLKNNYSSRIIIKNISVGDINSNFDQNLLSGAQFNFIISSEGVCADNKIIEDVVINFESKYGLEHIQKVEKIGFDCSEFKLNEILRFFYIPQRNLDEGIISNMTTLGDENYSFDMSGVNDSNYITKLIDTKKTTTSLESVIVNPNGLLFGKEINPEVETTLANGLVALWHLNEDSNATEIIDLSGNEHNGVRSSEKNVPLGVVTTTVGDYTVHTFYSSGTFIPEEGVDTIDVLLVGGGGGGGFGHGGGGGGGAVVYKNNLSLNNPIASCKTILDNGLSVGDGIYSIDPDGEGGNSPFDVYCDMTYDGGGWTLMMKATQGTEFNYNSSHWTTNDTLNESQTNLDDGDAKFRSFNEVHVNELMARWPDIDSENKYWVENNFNGGVPVLLPQYFSTANLDFIKDAQIFINENGWQSVFSSQTDIRFYGFNFVNPRYYGKIADVRWGFGWNENGEGLYSSPATLSSGGGPGSDDVSGGIGMSSSFGSYSAGDSILCCQNGTGMNRAARVEVYGRNSQAGAYTITVGEGGAGAPNNTTAAKSGESTTAFSVSATGGGYGASEEGDSVYSVGGNGANGGGGCYNKSGGTGTAPSLSGWNVYAGNNGGSGTPSGNYYSTGGGAGAGAAGETPINNLSNGGNGGAGVQINFGVTDYYWGGGGGGTVYNGGASIHGGNGGIGGGGAGAGSSGSIGGTGGGSAINNGSDGGSGNDTSGGNGGNNTGGGGGAGANENGVGGDGGSGIAIIKYLTSLGSAKVSSVNNGLWGTNMDVFNEPSEYISGSDSGFPSGNSPRTISFWAYPTVLSGNYQIIFFYGTYSSSSMTEIGINNGNQWHVSQHGIMLSGSTPQLNKWSFITVVFEDDVWYLYLNGEQIGSKSMSTNTVLNQFIIGTNPFNSYFKGKLDEVAIWDRAFSADEVSDLFNKGVSKIGVQARACPSEDCSTEWSEVQYGSNDYKYFSLPRSKYFQFKITSELIPFNAKEVISESCVSPYGPDSWDGCYSYFWDYSSCSNYNWHNNSCYWYEYGYCYPSIDCYSQGGDTCWNYGGCYWNEGYCYSNMSCYDNYDSGSCESYPACDWYPYYYCEGSMWSYCYDNFKTEESCTARSECYWGGDGCYSNTECYYLSNEDCGNYPGYCYVYDYGYCEGDQYSYCNYNFYDESSCSSQSGCSWNPSYCEGDQYGYCNYNFYDSGSCNSQNGCYWNIDYAYCEGGFRCEDQLNEGSSSCNAFGSWCNYTASSSKDYLSYFYNATPKLVDINVLYWN